MFRGAVTITVLFTMVIVGMSELFINRHNFHLVGIAAKTLKRNGMSAEASEMTEKVFGSGSYEEALGIIGEYVNITSVDEPNEDMEMGMR